MEALALSLLAYALVLALISHTDMVEDRDRG
jgi:hypothetical protein